MLSDEKAARMLNAFRTGRTLRGMGVTIRRFEAYCDAHPQYAAEAVPVLDASRKSANQRKGADRRNQTHCKRGHSLADAYVYVSRGWEVRNCRTCHHLRNNENKPLPVQEAQTVKSMLLANKSIAEITGRKGKRQFFVSSNRLYSARRADPAFDAFVKEHMTGARKLRWSLFRSQRATAERREEANDYHAIRSLIPSYVADADEIVGRIFEDMLSGALNREDVPKRIRFYLQEREKLFPTKYRKFGDELLVSLDDKLFDNGDVTRGDRITRGLWD